MARFSKAAGHIKLEDGDKILGPFGVRAVVETLMIAKSFVVEEGDMLRQIPAHVTVFARIKNAETCNIFNLSEIEAVLFEGKWQTLKGEAVEV